MPENQDELPGGMFSPAAKDIADMIKLIFAVKDRGFEIALRNPVEAN